MMSLAFIVSSVPFTKAVVAGETSLGGSESACLGLARALAKRGHDVHVFASQLSDDAMGPDAAGVVWHDLNDFRPMNQFIEWDVVISLRMFAAFGVFPIYARLRLLWSQDLLVPGQMQQGVMACAWAYDQIVYVSDYHRAQWEDLQSELKAIGWVTRNGFDPAHLPARTTKDPSRIIHISRPERGLSPLLQMWPALRAKVPHATLQICRYSSMYDQGPGSWTDVCQSFDREVAAVNAAVGGIEYLGELTKPELYQAVSDAAVMWYPGVATFAETSCIAATEANACGTPFVGSLRGALVDTARPSYDAGLLIDGDAERDPAYHEASIAAVARMLEGCQRQSFEYRAYQRAGRTHAESYRYDTIAAEWEQRITATFEARHDTHRIGILRQLLHEDDHVAAKVLAEAIIREGATGAGLAGSPSADDRIVDEAARASAFCDKVIAGKDHDAEHYGAAAIQDPLKEIEFSSRFKAVQPQFEPCRRVLDVACGNGSFAIGLAMAYPHVHVYGLDYSLANIERAREGAERAGVADRCVFECRTVYDFDAQMLHGDWLEFASLEGGFDGLFVGEFIEHVANCQAVIDGLETVLLAGAKVVYTCPHGACAELVPRGVPLRRGHVHRFHHDDIKAVWGPKYGCRADYLAGGTTERGNPLGNWLISYAAQPNRPAGARLLATRIQRTRPLQKVSVGLIVKDVENDLGRCLASIYKQADEIVVGDTGSTDTTKAIAESYGARVLDVAPILQQPEGFAGARNVVLHACTGDWFLWIDADEQLMEGPWLRRYIDGLVFNGFVLPQTHLYLDGPPTFDIPVRLFRHTGQVRFFGCVHEQPQDGDANADIHPTLQVVDLKLAHTGYLSPEGREQKRVERNLPLLLRDQTVFSERVLGKVLALREAVLQADAMRASHGGAMTANAQRGYGFAVRMFIDHFDDPGHKYHKIARPWYEVALKNLGIGWEHEIALAGRQGGLNGSHAQPERLWVRDADEYQRLMRFKTAGIAKNMEPTTFKTAPFVLPAMRTAREAVSA